MSTIEKDELADAKRQGQAQFDSIKEMVEDVERADSGDKVGFAAVEEARQRIHEDALSVEVRSGWYVPGVRDADTKPAEYQILLCTGGPACRIIGDLNEYGEPETARLEVQDWFQPWTSMHPLVGPDDYDSEPIMLDYARCFYFGEG
jgi:hypothetical protein